jgi:hypothetical protein
MDTREWVNGVVDAAEACGDPHAPFFYVGGPMSNVPQFNFPRFEEVAGKLREQGYNIVSPVELVHPEKARIAMQSTTGKYRKRYGPWDAYLCRDLVICAMPNCQGIILLDGWESSRGARAESFICDTLGKDCFVYEDDGPTLIKIDRTEALNAVCNAS